MNLEWEPLELFETQSEKLEETGSWWRWCARKPRHDMLMRFGIIRLFEEDVVDGVSSSDKGDMRKNALKS